MQPMHHIFATFYDAQVRAEVLELVMVIGVLVVLTALGLVMLP